MIDKGKEKQRQTTKRERCKNVRKGKITQVIKNTESGTQKQREREQRTYIGKTHANSWGGEH